MEFYKNELINWVSEYNPAQLEELLLALPEILPFEIISFVNDLQSNNLKLYRKKGYYPQTYLASIALKNYKFKKWSLLG